MNVVTCVKLHYICMYIYVCIYETPMYTRAVNRL